VCIFNKFQAFGLFLASDGTSTHTYPFTTGKKYRKLVNNAVFICNESLFFFVSGAATCAIELHYYRCLCIPIKAHAVVAMQHVPCGL